MQARVTLQSRKNGRSESSHPTPALAAAGSKLRIGTRTDPDEHKADTLATKALGERRVFESRMGADFAAVRIHADERADRAARAVHANAFALGRHLVFAREVYCPGEPAARCKLDGLTATFGLMPGLELSGGSARGVAERDPDSAEADHDFSRIPTYGTGDPEPPTGSFRRPISTGIRFTPGAVGGVSDGGEPLAGTARRRIESILGTRVGDVRIHHGRLAERAASAVGAPAFTVGQDIVFGGAARGAAQYARGSAAHRPSPQAEHLLAHEAAHAVQQSGAAASRFWGSSPMSLGRTRPGGAVERQADAAAMGLARPTPGAALAIAAAPPTAPTLTPSRSFKELFGEFEKARFGFDDTKTAALARQLAEASYDHSDLIEHGIEVVSWLQDHGERKLANSLLDKVRDAWMLRFVSAGSKLPTRNTLGLNSSDPSKLIVAGTNAAHAGEHQQAIDLLGVANEILSYYAFELTQERTKKLEQESIDQADVPEAERQGMAFPRMIARTQQYSSLQEIYDEMREIYGVYSAIEKEALAAGDTKGAAAARANSDKLHKRIKEKHTWGDTQTPGGISQEVLDPVEIAEVEHADTPKGPGLKLHGANSAETTITQLPGLPSPKEVGNNVQIQNLGALQSAVMAQTDFQAEIGRQPEIRKAFGNKPIDMNDTADRQKVWLIMYGVFKQSGGGGALGQLMALVGRYLKAYTIHTQYNVRDWGKNYLDSDMPTDLAGRAERDCGVYALTVAWDVYQTVKRGDAKLDVSFELTTMLEHVTLVIRDRSAGEYYVVNNDQVSRAHTGDPLTQVAPQYGAVRGLPYTVGPAATVELGSTKDSSKTFHDKTWEQYKGAVDWGLRTDIPPDVEALRKTDPAEFSKKVGELVQKRYKDFYRDQEIFDRNAKELDKDVDALAAAAGDMTKLAAALGPVTDKAAALAVLFTRLGPTAGIVAGSTKSQKVLPQKSQYLFTIEQGHTVHPIARAARAVLHLKALGGSATPKQDALVQFCQAIPIFKQQTDSYQAAGATGRF